MSSTRVISQNALQHASAWGLDVLTVTLVVRSDLTLEGQPVSGYQLEGTVYISAECANHDATAIHELRHVWQSRNGHTVTAYGTLSDADYADSSSERDARLAEARYKYSVKPNARLETLIKNLEKYELRWLRLD